MTAPGGGPGPPVVGRDRELAAVGAAVDRPGTTVVRGAPGIGKTTVATAGVTATGRTLWSGGGLPALVDRPGLALARAVRVPLPGDPDDAATLVAALVRDDVLLLDDAHWADDHSVTVTRRAGGRVRAVLCRTAGPGAADGSEDGDHVIELGPLEDEAISRIIEALDPACDPETIRRHVASAGGNPGAAVHLATGDVPSARRSLATVAQSLTPAGRTALVTLGLAGRPLRIAALGHGGPELIGAGIAREEAQSVVGFRSAATYALAASLAPTEVARAVHRHLAAVGRHPVDIARHLDLAGDTSAAVDVALGGAAGATDDERARLLRFAAERTGGERSRRLWHDAAEAARLAGDVRAASHARRRAVSSALTPRESEVMDLVAEGLTTPAVARRLQISADTVETHVRSAMRKLGARNRMEAAALLARGAG